MIKALTPKYHKSLKKIKLILLIRGIPQAELARRLGVSEAYISYVITGKRPGREARKKIAKILGVAEEELFKEVKYVG